MKLNKQLLAIAFFIIMAELLAITFVVDAVKQRVVEGVITADIEKQRILATTLARNLENAHNSLHQKLHILIRNPQVLNGSASVCGAELAGAASDINSEADNLIRTNKSGEIYCAQNKAAIGINVLEDEAFKTLFENPSDNAHIMHRVTLSPVSNEYVIGMHMAVFSDNDEFLGTLGGAIYMSRLYERYLKDSALFKEGRISLIDDNGDILYHQTPQIVGTNLLSDEMVNELKESDREDYKNVVKGALNNISEGSSSVVRYHYDPEPESLAVYYPVEVLPDRHWAVIVSVPTTEITRQVEDSTLVAGIKSFSVLTVAMIAFVMITQIILFMYLISHLARHLENKKE